jgi:hypothetical protein
LQYPPEALLRNVFAVEEFNRCDAFSVQFNRRYENGRFELGQAEGKACAQRGRILTLSGSAARLKKRQTGQTSVTEREAPL